MMTIGCNSRLRVQRNPQRKPQETQAIAFEWKPGLSQLVVCVKQEDCVTLGC